MVTTAAWWYLWGYRESEREGHREGQAQEKPYRLKDAGGLYLWVTATGKFWRWKYRFHGQEKLMTFGPWPDVTLKEAREQRDAARRLLRSGVDPMAERKKVKQAERAKVERSFEKVTQQWHAHWKKNRDPTARGACLATSRSRYPAPPR